MEELWARLEKPQSDEEREELQQVVAELLAGLGKDDPRRLVFRLNEAKSAEIRGDAEEALQLYTDLALDPLSEKAPLLKGIALCDAGVLLLRAQKKEQAFALFQGAAALGNARGTFEVALSLLNGRGVARDTEKASTWMQAASDRGHPFGTLIAARSDKLTSVERKAKLLLAESQSKKMPMALPFFDMLREEWSKTSRD